jgi:hypothetical protein
MELQYTVHSIHTGDVQKNVIVGGEEAVIVTKKIVVELVPDNDLDSAIKLVLPVSSGIDYANGATIKVTFEEVKAKA